MRKLSLFFLLALLLAGVVPVMADDAVIVRAYALTNIRSGPGTSYSIIGILLSGDEAAATGRDGTGNEWLRISFDDREGWVAASVVTVEGDPTSLEIVTPSNPESNIAEGDVIATTPESVNIRVGPGESYRVIDETAEGDSFAITGRTAIDYPVVCRGSRILDLTTGETAEDVWLRINFNGFDAWVAYSVASVSGDVCNVTEAANNDMPDEVESFLNEVWVVTMDNANLRASNYPTSEVITVIPFDTTLVVEARNEEASRIRVTFDDQTGWIATSVIDVVRGNIDNLPVEEE